MEISRKAHTWHYTCSWVCVTPYSYITTFSYYIHLKTYSWLSFNVLISSNLCKMYRCKDNLSDPWVRPTDISFVSWFTSLWYYTLREDTLTWLPSANPKKCGVFISISRFYNYMKVVREYIISSTQNGHRDRWATLN